MTSASTLSHDRAPTAHGLTAWALMDVRNLPAALLDGALQLGIRGLLWLVERAEAGGPDSR